MAWTAPMTAVSGNILTAAQFNTYVRDNLLETAPAKATTDGQLFVASGTNSISARSCGSNNVSTNEATTSTTFTNLTTVGPSVTVDTGAQAMVSVRCHMSNDTLDAFNVMSFDVSGMTTIAASETYGSWRGSTNASQTTGRGITHLITGLTAGSNTFTAKYKVSSGSGSFAFRTLIVVPL